MKNTSKAVYQYQILLKKHNIPLFYAILIYITNYEKQEMAKIMKLCL